MHTVVVSTPDSKRFLRGLLALGLSTQTCSDEPVLEALEGLSADVVDTAKARFVIVSNDADLARASSRIYTIN